MIKFRLTVLSFLQFFIWGCWLLTIGADIPMVEKMTPKSAESHFLFPNQYLGEGIC